MKEIVKAIRQTVEQRKEIVAHSAGSLIEGALEGADKIPLVRSAVAILTIRDNLQIAKLKRNCESFLRALENDSDDELSDFVGRSVEEDYEFAEALIEVLYTSTTHVPSEVVGKLVSAAVSGHVDYGELVTLTHIVNSASPVALNSVPDYFEERAKEVKTKGTGERQDLRAHSGYLVSMGLMDMNRMPQRPTELAVKLYLYGFNGDEDHAQMVESS